MKNILHLLVIIFTLSSPAAYANNIVTVTNKLKTYSAKYFAEINDAANAKEESNASDDEIDALIQDKKVQLIMDMKAAVKALEDQKVWDPILLQEVIRLANLATQNDPSGYMGDVLLPLYQKDKAKLLKEISKLPKKDART